MSEPPHTRPHTPPEGRPAPPTPSGPRGNASGFPEGSSAVSPLGPHGPGDPRRAGPEGTMWLRGGGFKARGLSHGRARGRCSMKQCPSSVQTFRDLLQPQSPGLPSMVKALGNLPVLTPWKAVVSQLPPRLLYGHLGACLPPPAPP